MRSGSLLPVAVLGVLALGAASAVGACSRSAPEEAPMEAPMPMVPPLPPPPVARDRTADLPPAALVDLGLRDLVEGDAGPAAAYPGLDAGAAAESDAWAPLRVTRRGSRAAALAVAACDSPDGGDADCPLRGWMRENATKAILAKDFGALERVFTSLAAMAPTDDYPHWVSIAKDGAAATHVLHLDAVKATCRSCHQQYRDKYRKERRSTPLPPLFVR